MQQDFILLDRSGSMGGPKWEETVSSVNAYVKELAEKMVDTKVTLACFDGHNGLQYLVLRDGVAPGFWNPIMVDEAPPRGSTPLNDSIGRLVGTARQSNPDRAAIIIMTDGQENASTEVTTEKAKELLQDCRNKGWQVVFLGADYDNMAQARSYGNDPRATMDMAAGNYATATASLATQRASYGATGQSIGWSTDEKQKVAGKKQK